MNDSTPTDAIISHLGELIVEAATEVAGGATAAHTSYSARTSGGGTAEGGTAVIRGIVTIRSTCEGGAHESSHEEEKEARHVVDEHGDGFECKRRR
jgi:hypothetical protein